MGTRHLIAVQLDGQYRIAQYGQWDGYPSGQGERVIEFLKAWDRPLFDSKLRAASFLTKEEVEEINGTIKRENLGDTWQNKWPALTRDTGAEILKMVQDSAPGMKLKNSIDFAGDSLFCEYAYVIDLDTNKLELFVGFNGRPLEKGDRFFGAKLDPEGQKREDGSPKYYPIRLAKAYDLQKLPTVQQMERACNTAKNKHRRD